MAYGPPTITQQRERWNAVPDHPPIRLRSQWGAQRLYTDENPVIYPATKVFIHISVTNPGNYNGNDAHAQAIERIGISRFPNTGISYNFGVMPNGALYEFMPVGRRGAHTVNDEKRTTCTKHGTACPGYRGDLTTPGHAWNLNYNARSIVFCGMESTSVTSAVVSIIALTVYTMYKAGFITETAARGIHGHRCVSAKACPGAKMWAVMKTIQSKINQLLATGTGGGSTTPEASMIGLKKGNTGERVKALQVMLGYSGFPRAGGVQSSATYDTATAAAVKKMSLSVNSGSTSDGNTITAYVYAHLLVAFSRKYAGKPGAPGPAPTTAQLQAAVAAWITANPSAVQPPDAEVKAFVEGWLAAHAEEIRGPAGKTPTKIAISGDVIEVE
jgi:hypothetical protein